MHEVSSSILCDCNLGCHGTVTGDTVSWVVWLLPPHTSARYTCAHSLLASCRILDSLSRSEGEDGLGRFPLFSWNQSNPPSRPFRPKPCSIRGHGNGRGFYASNGMKQAVGAP